MEWFAGGMGFCLFVLYIFMIFTVAIITFRKGHIVLGILGIFLPILWLIGAILPAKKGSRYDIEQGIRYQQQIDEYTR
jgi:uncharacterized membrane protein